MRRRQSSKWLKIFTQGIISRVTMVEPLVLEHRTAHNKYTTGAYGFAKNWWVLCTRAINIAPHEMWYGKAAAGCRGSLSVFVCQRLCVNYTMHTYIARVSVCVCVCVPGTSTHPSIQRRVHGGRQPATHIRRRCCWCAPPSLLMRCSLCKYLAKPDGAR